MGEDSEGSEDVEGREHFQGVGIMLNIRNSKKPEVKRARVDSIFRNMVIFITDPRNIWLIVGYQRCEYQ